MVPPRAATHILPEKMLSASCLHLVLIPPFVRPHKFPTPVGVFQPNAEAFAIPPAILVTPCSQSLSGSKPQPLDFGLVFVLLALDAVKSDRNCRLSEVLLAKTYSIF